MNKNAHNTENVKNYQIYILKILNVFTMKCSIPGKRGKKVFHSLIIHY